jgi:hypothetical protein
MDNELDTFGVTVKGTGDFNSCLAIMIKLLDASDCPGNTSKNNCGIMKSPYTPPPAGLPIYALNGAYTAKNILGI